MKLKMENGRLYVKNDIERDYLGDCKCGEPVYASEGQLITWATRTNKFTGESTRFPIHKKCRKTMQKSE